MKKLLALSATILVSQFTNGFCATSQFIENYTVQVTLSPAAAAKLKKSGETIEIDAVYFGEPVAGDKTPIGEDGNIPLGRETKTIKGESTATLGHIKFDGKLLKHIIDGEPSVLNNLYTSRKKFPDNLLDCDFFQDKVSLAVSKPLVIACKLIDE